MKAIERDGEFLRAHGSYIEDWTDEKGHIWKHVMEIPHHVAKAFLECALVWQEGVSCISDLRKEDDKFLSWLKVRNKEFVVIHVDNFGKVQGLTNRDGHMYLIVASEMDRVFKFMETYQRSPDRLQVAMEVLMYDCNDDKFKYLCI